jgi:hypothetical protein
LELVVQKTDGAAIKKSKESQAEEPEWWLRLLEAQALFQATYKDEEPPDPIELINGRRQERDDMILNAAIDGLRKSRIEDDDEENSQCN